MALPNRDKTCKKKKNITVKVVHYHTHIIECIHVSKQHSRHTNLRCDLFLDSSYITEEYIKKRLWGFT